MQLRRFQVAEASMLPHLLPGDHLLAVSGLRFRRGDVVVFPHPRRADFWLVKRVAALPGDPLDDGDAVPPARLWVLSDNREATRADSRSLGPVPSSTAYRVVARYRPVRRATVRLRRHPPRLPVPDPGR